MRADKFLAGVAYSDYPALLFNMVFFRMESIPTNAPIVILMGVLIACSIHISSAAKASVVKAVAKSAVNTNAKSNQQKALEGAVSSTIFEAVLERFAEQQASSDATNSAIFNAILNRIAQLEAQRVTPPPASPRLTLSATSALDTSPELPTHRRASLSVSVLSSQETIPQKPKVPALSLSDISSQTVASVEPAVPVLSVFSILTQTSDVVLNKAPTFSFSPVSTLSTSPVEPMAPILALSTVTTQTSSAVESTAPVLSFSPVSTQSSAPMSPKLQPLSIGSVSEQSSTPVSVKFVNLSLSDIMIMSESVPMMAPSESYVMKWHSGDPHAIIKTLEAITHGLVMQNFKLNASIQANGTYVAGELYRRKQQVEDLQTHYRSMCIQHVIEKASVAKQNTDIEVFAHKVIDLNEQIATLTVLAEKAWASEDALKDQVVTVGAQLSEARISESALKDQVANIEDQLDEDRMKVAKIKMELDSARNSESALKDKLANIELELSKTTIAKNELQEEVFDITAQLEGVMMPESTSEEIVDLQEQLVEARKRVASIEEELDDVRTSNFMLQDEADNTNELLGETTALYNKVGNMEVELRESRNSEQVLQQEVNKYAAIIRAIQNAGINIEKYKILAKVEVTPIVDKVTSSFGAGLDAIAHTTTFTSPSEAKSTFLSAIEFKPVINTAQSTLNLFASAFSFDTASTLPPAISIEAESPVTTPLVTETTTPIGSGLGDSQYTTAPASDMSPAIETKYPVIEITTPAKGGLGSSKYAPVLTSSSLPTIGVKSPVIKITTPVKGVLVLANMPSRQSRPRLPPSRQGLSITRSRHWLTLDQASTQPL
jgi:predicted  nucleic acid-binding Zn-ribbon protein